MFSIFYTSRSPSAAPWSKVKSFLTCIPGFLLITHHEVQCLCSILSIQVLTHYSAKVGLVTWCKTALSPLLMHWRYGSLALIHQDIFNVRCPCVVADCVCRMFRLFKPFIHLILVGQIMVLWLLILNGVNTLRPRKNRPHFADDPFKCSFLKEMYEF